MRILAIYEKTGQTPYILYLVSDITPISCGSQNISDFNYCIHLDIYNDPKPAKLQAYSALNRARSRPEISFKNIPLGLAYYISINIIDTFI